MHTVHVVVETKQSEVMNEQNEDLKTINKTFETNRNCETETLIPSRFGCVPFRPSVVSALVGGRGGGLTLNSSA